MSKRSREGLTPELTPLIDVVFLLLIFFMVSTVFKKNELALIMSLPQSSKGESATEKKQLYQIELSVEQIAFNGKATSFEEIDSLLSSIKSTDTPIELRIDKEVKYNRVIQLLDKLKIHKLANLELITEQ